MKDDKIDLEEIISVLDQVPRKTPWFYVLYAYMIAALRWNKGYRLRTSIEIKMPIRSLRYKFGAMEVLGFKIPDPPNMKKPGAKERKRWRPKKKVK